MLAEEAAKKAAEEEEHVKAMEDMGYDMSCYCDKSVTSDPEELEKEIEAARVEDKSMMADRMRQMSPAASKPVEIDTATGEPYKCSRECHLCMRKHCPNRKPNC